MPYAPLRLVRHWRDQLLADAMSLIRSIYDNLGGIEVQRSHEED